jgi:hypothetical protein
MKDVNARQPFDSLFARMPTTKKTPVYFGSSAKRLLLLDTSRTSSFPPPHGIMDVVHSKDSICYKRSLRLQLVTRMKIEWSSYGCCCCEYRTSQSRSKAIVPGLLQIDSRFIFSSISIRARFE